MSPVPRLRRAGDVARGALVLAVGLALAGCGPKVVSEDVFEEGEVRVTLRRVIEDGEPVRRGHDHPITISDVRVAHILASLSYRDDEGRTRPLVRSEHVYPLAQGLNQALEKAGPDDEVLAAIVAIDRKFGIFTHRVVTAMRVAFLDDRMRIELFEVEEPLEGREGKEQRRDYEFPLEPEKRRPDFQLVAAPSQLVDHSRTIVVDWRDPYYGRPVSLSVRGGRIRRRTILMEAEPEELAPVEPRDVDTVLRDAQLRALDQLDAARRSGLISEAEFQRRRALIVEGRLEEAGYDVE